MYVCCKFEYVCTVYIARLFQMPIRVFIFFIFVFFPSLFVIVVDTKENHRWQSLVFFSLIFCIFLLVGTVDKQHEAVTHQSFVD